MKIIFKEIVRHALCGMIVVFPAIQINCKSAETADTLRLRAEVLAGGATGNFNPYLASSYNHGRTPMAGTALLDVGAFKTMNLERRFGWEAGVEMLTGYSAKTDYLRYNSESKSWTYNRQGPSAAWLQQAYGSVKYRGVFLTAGLKEYGSLLVDNALSSGDLVQSTAARPIAQVRVGFVDFQDIPFTKGWVQIEGCISYGKMTDNDYLRDHYNYYNYHLATGLYYTYKRAYFRTNPDKPLTVTVGVQSAGTFGGKTVWYNNGVEGKTVDNPEDLKAFWNMFIPSLRNGDGYVEGSHLGSWDFRASYTVGGKHRLSGYFQWLWEDGSSMGKRNKWDGLWGIQYSRADCGKHLLQSALAEYIDFRDQSGPMHWAPGDNAGTDITTEATGGDDYYNNTSFNGYSNYGMSLGTPFVVSPLYNRDGFPQYLHSRTRGFQLSATGWLTPELNWTAMLSHAVAWGTGRIHQNEALKNTSMLVRCGYDASSITPGLEAGLTLAFDAGKLRGDTFGAMLNVRYTTDLTFGK